MRPRFERAYRADDAGSDMRGTMREDCNPSPGLHSPSFMTGVLRTPYATLSRKGRGLACYDNFPSALAISRRSRQANLFCAGLRKR